MGVEDYGDFVFGGECECDVVGEGSESCGEAAAVGVCDAFVEEVLDKDVVSGHFATS